MAEANVKNTIFSDAQKFCLAFYERKYCKQSCCPFLHRKRSSIEVVEIRPDEGYVLGRCPLIPLCRYFLRGYCTHAGNCHFRHEITAPINNINDKTSIQSIRSNSDNSLTTNSLFTTNPSTSSIDIADTKNNNNKLNMIDINANSDENNIVDVMDDNNQDDYSEIGAVALPLEDQINKYNINAPEFIPKFKNNFGDSIDEEDAAWGDDRKQQLCPYAAKDGVCKFLPGECVYLHGEICEFCGCAALHPHNIELRKKHEQDCIKQHERNMELSFGIARSKDKSCGICFEIVMEKGNGESRFGIMPNCNHCFCLTCIRRWRRAHQFDNKIIRACPECRVTSDFICPSLFWVDKPEDKTKLIEDYKTALTTKDCKYFGRGNGKCPFGNKCFYRHAFPDGRICDVGPPPRRRRFDIYIPNREVLHQDVPRDILENLDYVTYRMLTDEYDDDLGDFFSDSDDSDCLEFDFLF